MTGLRMLIGRLRNLWRARRLERDLDREIAAHLALLEDDLRRRGLSPEDAAIAARRTFGGIDRTRELHREARALALVGDLLRDLGYATRMLRKTPQLTAVAALTLALGIGASTAVFTHVNAIFLTPLPVDRPGDLRILSWASARRPFAGPRLTQRIWDQWIAEGLHVETFSPAAYRQLTENDAGFESVACWRRGAATSATFPTLTMQYVSAGYFQTMRADAAVGRVLGPIDDTNGGAIPVVLSHGGWQRLFGGDPAVLGAVLDLEQGRFLVVGVMPAGFFGVALAVAPDFFAPLAAAPRRSEDDWGACNLIARLRRDVPEELARSRAETLIGHSILAAPPREAYDPPRVWLTNAARGDDDLRRGAGTSLGLLMAATSLVFLIACANVAGLLLARGAGRAREMATRLALGATRRRIVQQLLTEYALISLLGAVFGLALAFVLVPLLPTLLMQLVGRQALAEVAPDARVLAFAIGLAVLNGVVFGLLPALHGPLRHHATLAAPARDGARFRTGKVLVAVQVALSLTLLVGAGLCMRSLINLRTVPLGYDPDGLVFVTLNASPRQATLVRETLERLMALPGVRAATVSQYPLFGAAERSLPLCVPGFMTSDPDHRFVDGDQVGPGYFAAWGVRILDGRDFTWEDVRRRHVIVNTAFATKFFDGHQPIGRTLGFGPKCTGVEQTIIGVVANSTNIPREAGRPMIYAPYRQNVGFATFALRVDNADRFVPVLQAMLTEQRSSLRSAVTTGVDYRNRELARERLTASFLGVFSALAVVLACVGLYGTLACLVARRTPEIGVRMALGAGSAAVVRLVLSESLRPVLFGLFAGATLAAGATRALEHLLFGISRHDPLVTMSAVALFVILAACAATAPAIRAARIDPAVTLRHD
jgi:predicted permease